MTTWRKIVICCVLLLILPVTGKAEETCTVTASTVTAEAGETVSIPLTIGNNPGFTNFSLQLEYDNTALELTQILPGAMCGNLVRVNQNVLVCARADVTEENGTLATAVFRVQEGASGKITVSGKATYFRRAEGSVFQDLSVTAVSGGVQLKSETEEKPEQTCVTGDVNGDGCINALDAALVYDYLAGCKNLNEQQREAADVDGNGIVDRSDAIWIYRYVNHRATAFPKALKGE